MTKILYVRFQNQSGDYRYASKKEYSYVYTGNIAAEVGDIAVVDSPYSGRRVVEITRVRDKTDLDSGLKSAVGVISTADTRREKEQAQRRKDLERKIDALIKQQQKASILKTLAADIPEARALLAELEELR